MKISKIGMSLLFFANSSFGAGFYVGASVGPDTGNFSQHAHISHPGDLNTFDDADKGATGVFGSIFAGYAVDPCLLRIPYRQIYLAGEVNANASTLEFNSANKEFFNRTFSTVAYKINYSFGVSLLPGYSLCDTTLFYARLGYVAGHFNVSTSDPSLVDKSAYLNGFRAGLGLEQTVYPGVSVRLEWSHIEYSSLQSYTLDPRTFVAKRTTVNPRTNQFEFGIDYRFC